MNEVGDKSNKLSIIIINYNTKDLLKRCLEVIDPDKLPPEWELLVVDNASTDGSTEMVKKDFKSVKLVKMSKNEGFSKAANRGIKSFSSNYYLILNSDTEVTREDIKELLDLIDSDESIGAVSPFQVDSNEVPQLCWGRFPTFFSEIRRKRLQRSLDKFSASAVRKIEGYRIDDAPFFVDWVSGATMMIRYEALKEAGLFDEEIFIFFEDIDLCTRIRHASWRVAMFPAVVVIHHRGESAKKEKFNSSLHYRRSQLYFWRKHHSRFSLLFLKCYILFKFIIRIINLRIKYMLKSINREYMLEEISLARSVIGIVLK